MKSLSAEFRQKLYNNERDYLAFADITLADSTFLSLTNSEIWSGGFSYEEAVSGDDTFSAIGSVIIGSATLIINNIYGTYSEYDFTGAEVVLYLGMQLSTELEKFKIGTYTVDDTNYNGATIRLSLLDNMEQFDRPYSSSTLAYPATLDVIVRDACSKCGILLDTYNFPHKTYEITTRPNDESITYREVLSWCATVAGCFAKCNPDGKLELKWFDQASLEALADIIDGGVFNPWNVGTVYSGGLFNPWNVGTAYDGGEFSDESGVHYITALYKQDIAIDDVVITGVSIPVKDESDNAQQSIITYSTGTSGYVVELSENPFITKSNAQTIINWLGTQLIGLRFRKLDVSIASDPSIESGDVGIVIDRKQNVYPTLITRTNFSVGATQTVVCGASSPSRNSSTRFSSTTKSYVEARKLLKQEKSERELAEADIRQQLANGSGLHYTEVEDTSVTPSTTIYYLHDKTNLADSDIRIKFSTGGIAVTSNGKSANPDWYGLTPSGNMILNLLATTGILFDWAKGGTLTLGGDNNVNGVLQILNSSGVEIGVLNKDGASLIGSLTMRERITHSTSAYLNTKVGEFRAFRIGQTSDNAFYGLYLANTGDLDSGRETSTSLGIATAYYWGGFNDSSVRIVSSKNIEIVPNSAGSTFISSGYLILDDQGFQLLEWGTQSGIMYRNNSGSPYLQLKGPNASSTVRLESGLIYTTFDITVSNSPQIKIQGFNSSVECAGSLSVSGTKSRNVKTKDYSDRLLYCYETASPMFGDIGEGIIGTDGKCYVSIDPIFVQTVNLNQYQVFLQKYDYGECYVAERHPSYFIVLGTEGLRFGWEIKAKQSDFDQFRLEKNEAKIIPENEIDYEQEAINHINEIMKGRVL